MYLFIELFFKHFNAQGKLIFFVSVQCNTTELEGCGRCFMNDEIYDYTDVVELNCEFPGSAFCNSIGGWDVACLSGCCMLIYRPMWFCNFYQLTSQTALV